MPPRRASMHNSWSTELQKPVSEAFMCRVHLQNTTPGENIQRCARGVEETWRNPVVENRWVAVHVVLLSVGSLMYFDRFFVVENINSRWMHSTPAAMSQSVPVLPNARMERLSVSLMISIFREGERSEGIAGEKKHQCWLSMAPVHQSFLPAEQVEEQNHDGLIVTVRKNTVTFVLTRVL